MGVHRHLCNSYGWYNYVNHPIRPFTFAPPAPTDRFQSPNPTTTHIFVTSVARGDELEIGCVCFLMTLFAGHNHPVQSLTGSHASCSAEESDAKRLCVNRISRKPQRCRRRISARIVFGVDSILLNYNATFWDLD